MGGIHSRLNAPGETDTEKKKKTITTLAGSAPPRCIYILNWIIDFDARFIYILNWIIDFDARSSAAWFHDKEQQQE